MSTNTDKSMEFFGIPIIIDPHIPEGELWMVQEGQKSTVHVHEGPQAGEDVEVWLRKPQVFRIVNLGDPLSKMKIPMKTE